MTSLVPRTGGGQGISAASSRGTSTDGADFSRAITDWSAGLPPSVVRDLSQAGIEEPILSSAGDVASPWLVVSRSAFRRRPDRLVRVVEVDGSWRVRTLAHGRPAYTKVRFGSIPFDGGPSAAGRALVAEWLPSFTPVEIRDRLATVEGVHDRDFEAARWLDLEEGSPVSGTLTVWAAGGSETVLFSVSRSGVPAKAGDGVAANRLADAGLARCSWSGDLWVWTQTRQALAASPRRALRR